MFDDILRALRDLVRAPLSPADRRDQVHAMKESVVHARLALDELRDGLAATRRKLERETKELETMRRRRALAEGIADAETAALAARYEVQHAERAAVLAQKLAAEEQELALAERDLEAMMRLFSAAAKGAAAAAPAAPLDDDAPGLAPDAGLQRELDAMARDQARAAAEAAAEARLAELKRRLGQ
jgi:hypothetical protein